MLLKRQTTEHRPTLSLIWWCWYLAASAAAAAAQSDERTAWCMYSPLLPFDCEAEEDDDDDLEEGGGGGGWAGGCGAGRRVLFGRAGRDTVCPVP